MQVARKDLCINPPPCSPNTHTQSQIGGAHGGREKVASDTYF